MLRCLVATVGKDAPGINAAVRSATRIALRRGIEVYGAKRGFDGIFKGQFWKLREEDVGAILGKGGSRLGSTDFRIAPDDNETLDAVAQSLKKFDLAVVTGGLGSFALLDRVYSQADMGLTTTMFVPASIEGEFLDPTPSMEGRPRGIHAEAIGTDTAMNTAVDAVDRLREQSYLSKTLFLVECAGSKSNVLPVHIGMACGAHRIYLPSYPRLSPEAKDEIKEYYGGAFDPHLVDIKELVSWVESTFQRTKRHYLVVVLPRSIPLVNVTVDAERKNEPEEYEHIVSSSSTLEPLELIVLRLADALTVYFSGPGAVQVRYVILDDLQRGGVPTVRDRLLGSLYGEAAVEEFLAMLNWNDVERRGNLNLLAINDTNKVGWECIPRQSVEPLFKGPSARAGGLDPLPFFRQARGTVSGYRPLATL